MKKKSSNNKRRAEQGTAHWAKKFERLEKRVAALERDRKRRENWPEIIPLDDETREIFERGMEDVRAGRMTPAFSSSAEFEEYRMKKRANHHV
jgi:hypothetical protein